MRSFVLLAFVAVVTVAVVHGNAPVPQKSDQPSTPAQDKTAPQTPPAAVGKNMECAPCSHRQQRNQCQLIIRDLCA